MAGVYIANIITVAQTKKKKLARLDQLFFEVILNASPLQIRAATLDNSFRQHPSKPW